MFNNINDNTDIDRHYCYKLENQVLKKNYKCVCVYIYIYVCYSNDLNNQETGKKTPLKPKKQHSSGYLLRISFRVAYLIYINK